MSKNRNPVHGALWSEFRGQVRAAVGWQVFHWAGGFHQTNSQFTDSEHLQIVDFRVLDKVLPRRENCELQVFQRNRVCE